ncbi:hypothetical protein BS17DRAFT_784864 [Gyrodon lividus]|nr:hypothetical protein BS17DRAFT_784864 [Gyrodon lividus]
MKTPSVLECARRQPRSCLGIHAHSEAGTHKFKLASLRHLPGESTLTITATLILMRDGGSSSGWSHCTSHPVTHFPYLLLSSEPLHWNIDVLMWEHMRNYMRCSVLFIRTGAHIPPDSHLAAISRTTCLLILAARLHGVPKSSKVPVTSKEAFSPVNRF